jgi:uncharacterized protein (DUF3084 family)
LRIVEKTELEVAKETAEREMAKLKAEKELWLKEREQLRRERDAFEQELHELRDTVDTLKFMKDKLETKVKERAELEGRGDYSSPLLHLSALLFSSPLAYLVMF